MRWIIASISRGAETLGQHLGLPLPLVRVLVEEAQVTVSACCGATTLSCAACPRCALRSSSWGKLA